MGKEKFTPELLAEKIKLLQAQHEEELALDKRKTVVICNTQYATLRLEPTNISLGIGKIQAGRTVEVLDIVFGKLIDGNDMWFKVSHQGNIGYISATVARPELEV